MSLIENAVNTTKLLANPPGKSSPRPVTRRTEDESPHNSEFEIFQPGQNNQYLINKHSIVPRSCICSTASATSAITTSTATTDQFCVFHNSAECRDTNCTHAPSLSANKKSHLTSTIHYHHSSHNLSSVSRKCSCLSPEYGDNVSASSSEDLSNFASQGTGSREEMNLTWMEEFDAKLESVNYPTIKRISSAEDLNELLHYYYHERFQDDHYYDHLKSSLKLFPYLHGLDGINQRAFFLEGNDQNVDDITEVLEDNNLINLMFINTAKGKCSFPDLANTVGLEDILVPKVSTAKFEHFVHSSTEVQQIEDVSLVHNEIAYEDFHRLDHVWRIDIMKNQTGLNNRNYKEQIKLMAPLSSFVLYNYNREESLTLAILLNTLRNENKRQVIYVVDRDIDWTRISQEYFDNDLTDGIIYSNELVPSELEDVPSRFTDETYACKFLKFEQNLIWKLNSMKWMHNDKICLGNITDFNRISASGCNAFKLIISCHENASLPSMKMLSAIMSDLAKPNSASVYYLEFPSSGCFNANAITVPDITAFLNVLKLIYMVVFKYDLKVFIFSFDGFTGLSLLAICIAQLLGAKNTEDSIQELLENKGKPMHTSMRLYYFKSDLTFLKHFERIIDYLKNKLLDLPGYINSLDFHEMNSYHLIHPMQTPSKTDWFNPLVDNNFPSRIFDNLYLGSLQHANSTTILNSTKITNIISIGECPSWFSHFKNQVIFDYEVRNRYRSGVQVLSPIYSFNDNECHIYEVDFSNLDKRKLTYYGHNFPKYLKSLVFIHNLKDDGKDSILDLLTNCPDHIQSKFLLTESKETAPGTTLIHCRIGVSRSASIVLASMMRKFRLNLLSCYMYLRVQRFNIIIQPNLRLFYELYIFEHFLGIRHDSNGDRKGRIYNWEVLCSEIHKLNSHYID
ncbi:hypothetical protein G9P44_002957 [Scheffersomyces stipitis]|nr:hypothetical protein G9P44_002957 [Scheffersomyces stipitis]